MFYYLEETDSKCVLVISDDIYLINNMASGLLDAAFRTTDNKDLAEKVMTHMSNNTDIGISLVKGFPKPVSLRNFDTTAKKLKLAAIRKPCFEKLLKCVRSHTAMNKVGFNNGDEFYIQYALSNKNALDEYAEVLGMDPDFARKELTLISESALRDNFRVFTVSNLIKNKINQMTNESEIPDMIELITKAFTLYGILDV